MKKIIKFLFLFVALPMLAQAKYVPEHELIQKAELIPGLAQNVEASRLWDKKASKLNAIRDQLIKIELQEVGALIKKIVNSVDYRVLDAKIKAIEMEIENFAKVIKRIRRSRSELEETLDIKPVRIDANKKIAELLSRKGLLTSRRNALFYASKEYKKLKKKADELKSQYKKMRSLMLREQMQIAEKELEEFKKKILESKKFKEYAKKIIALDEKIKANASELAEIRRKSEEITNKMLTMHKEQEEAFSKEQEEELLRLKEKLEKLKKEEQRLREPEKEKWDLIVERDKFVDDEVKKKELELRQRLRPLKER